MMEIAKLHKILFGERERSFITLYHSTLHTDIIYLVRKQRCPSTRTRTHHLLLNLHLSQNIHPLSLKIGIFSLFNRCSYIHTILLKFSVETNLQKIFISNQIDVSVVCIGVDRSFIHFTLYVGDKIRYEKNELSHLIFILCVTSRKKQYIVNSTDLMRYNTVKIFHTYNSSSVTGVRRHMCSAPLIGNLKKLTNINQIYLYLLSLTC